MQANDPYILAAMDGEDSLEATNLNSKSRGEPTAFFYIVFGLVYDALTNASTDAASGLTSREGSIAALQTLKHLVRPEYSGRAILEPIIFKEFSSLCYRMAVTESAVVQLHLIDVITALASSQRNDIPTSCVFSLFLLFDAENHSSTVTDSLFPDIPLTHCLRVCAYVLRQNLPSARVFNSGSFLLDISVVSDLHQ